MLRTEHALRGVHETLVRNDRGKLVSPLLSPEFTELTQDLWRVAPETKKVGHPAAFPVELARRVIKLYGWPGVASSIRSAVREQLRSQRCSSAVAPR